jgi:two-component system, NtrC family, nitrogen regulation sensor histidine kinase NtrY
MILNRFFINILIRVFFIILSCLVLGIILPHLRQGYYYTVSGIIFLILFQTYWLNKKVNKTNSDLEKFLVSVQNQDSSILFPKIGTNKSFRLLHERLNGLINSIQTANIKSDRNEHLMQSLADHIDVGIIAFYNTGSIEICNQVARRYLMLTNPKQINTIKEKNEELFRIINTISPGKEILHKLIIDNFSKNILIKSVEFKYDNKTLKLVSFQDITNELDKKELDSWLKLIRVLTHEIMNSISPITSLTKVISGYFRQKDNEEPIPPENIDKQIIDKTLFGLNTIEETGKGLLDFVNKYRSFTTLPKPNKSQFAIGDLFESCILLMKTCISENITITTNVEPGNAMLVADYSQIEQVLINLIKNATDAISNKNEGFIKLKAISSSSENIIQVVDNGIGISNDIMENIFIPFYTTKENGSGIGLSLAKQIMQNHNGIISVNSAVNGGTILTLKF